MNARIEEWLDQMRQAREPGPLARVVVVRSGRTESWTFDVTEKTDLEDLAERIEATIRDANCRRCEMRALDAGGRFIDHLPYRVDQAALAQVIGPGGGLALPYEVTESVTAAHRSHKSFTVLALKGIAEGQEHSKQMVAMLMGQNKDLLDSLGQARRERAEEVAAVRMEKDAENARLRKENEELRERIDKQWEMEDELRTRYADKEGDIEKTKVAGRILGALGEAGVAHFFPKGSAGHRNIRQQIAERVLDSITKEQSETIFPVLTQEQQVMLANFIRLGVEAEQGAATAQADSSPKTSTDAAAAAAAANAAAAKEKN
ncbi:MAG TPA: hypothetical protein VF881_19935 [Polyangiaceae bacterium]